MDKTSQAQWKKLSAILCTGAPLADSELDCDLYRYYRHIHDERSLKFLLEDVRVLFELFAQETGAVLDLACGYGINTLILRLLGVKSVVGVDYDDKKTKTAQSLAEQCGVSSATFLQGIAHQLQFDDASFTGVVVTSAISHFYHLEDTLDEIYRVLKPGGVLVIHDDTNALHLPTRRKMRAIWRKSEYGLLDEIERLGLKQNFFQMRQGIIRELSPELSSEQAIRLAHQSRGWTANDLQAYLAAKQKGARHCVTPRFRCIDPVTAIPQEQLLNPFTVLRLLRKRGFTAELCAPPQWRYGGISNLGKFRKKLRYMLWPIQIGLYQDYYIRARKPL